MDGNSLHAIYRLRISPFCLKGREISGIPEAGIRRRLNSREKERKSGEVWAASQGQDSCALVVFLVGLGYPVDIIHPCPDGVFPGGRLPGCRATWVAIRGHGNPAFRQDRLGATVRPGSRSAIGEECNTADDAGRRGSGTQVLDRCLERHMVPRRWFLPVSRRSGSR